MQTGYGIFLPTYAYILSLGLDVLMLLAYHYYNSCASNTSISPNNNICM